MSNIRRASGFPLWEISTLNEPFAYEPSMIVEINGGPDLLQETEKLASELKEKYHQNKVLVYCSPIL